MSDALERIAERIARLENEVHVLKTAPKANKTSVRDGYTRWLPVGEANLPEVRIGSTVEGGGDPAFEVTDEDGPFSSIYIGTDAGRARADIYSSDKTGLVFCYDDGVLLAPQPSCSWQRWVGSAMDAVGMSTTTSATYVDLWYAVLGVGGDQIDGALDVIPDGGNTGAARIVAQVLGGVSTGGKVPSATVQQVVEQTGITTSTVMAGPWTVPESVWDPSANVAGAVLLLTIQGKRTAGAGSIHVAPRFPVFGVGA